MKESDIQNKIRLALSRHGSNVMFRNNVGQAWAGKAKRLPSSDVLIQDPYPITFGLCTGSSDLIGYTSVIITPDMVGKKVAIFTALEVKRPMSQPSPAQRQFIARVRQDGGRAGVCTNDHSAIQIVEGKL